MRKKILLLSLIPLLFLPAPGITQDVEIIGVDVIWREPSMLGCGFSARAWVANYTDSKQRVSGYIIFYDGDNCELYKSVFWGTVKAGETAILSARGALLFGKYEEMSYYEVTISKRLRRPW